MHHVPQPKDQARILKATLEQFGIKLPHQQALEVVAKMMGSKDWATHSALPQSVSVAPAKTSSSEALERPLLGPAGCDIYEAMVTVDVTMSACIRVQARDMDHADCLLREAAHTQFPQGFEVDEGNYRGVSDYYFGDSDAIVNLSEPLLDDQNNDFWAKATWHDALYKYEVELSRDEPDCSDEERQASGTLILRLHQEGLTETYTSELDVFGDLRSYLEEGLEEFEFDERFSQMSQELTKLKATLRHN